MTVLTDIATAMSRYPLDETTIAIVGVVVQDGIGPEINANEIFRFKVQVTNNGHVNMTDVFVHVNGKNGAHVSFHSDKGFAKDKTLKVGPFDVNAGGASNTTGVLYFKAPPGAKPAGTELLEAHIFDWNGNFDHYFTSHTNDEDHATVDYPSGQFAAQVFPA